MATEALLEVESVTKYYPVSKGIGQSGPRESVRALNGLSFTVNRGETVALVGESGCGKTTTAKAVLGLEKPSSGSLRLKGEDIYTLRGSKYRAYRRSVQAVFQDPWASLNPRMRIGDIISEPLEVNTRLSKHEIYARVDKALEDVGLQTDYRSRYPHEFSGGQRQRIAVAAALVCEPELIVLDEPVSSLDVSIRAQIMNLLKDLQDKYGMSYLLIAHDLATTRYMCDRIAVMYLGSIVELAGSEELFSRPMHPYTQALFSAALPSHPDVTRDEIVLSGEVPSPINPPSGCPFHTRCFKYLGGVCKEKEPQLQEMAEGHWVACHLYDT